MQLDFENPLYAVYSATGFYSRSYVFWCFLCVLSCIFFNTALRSPKVGKNVDHCFSVKIWCCLLPQVVGS